MESEDYAPKGVIEDKDRFELILTPTKRLYIIDFKKVKESITPTNE